MEPLPGRAPDVFSLPSVALLNADERVFEAMLDGWRNQMMARGLTTGSIEQMVRVIERFQKYTNDYPWSWTAHDLDEYFSQLRRRDDKPLALTTLRAYSGSIRAFCSYICDARYRWTDLCERLFDDLPSQIVFEWNSPRHTTDDAVPTRRRAFTKVELQRFFDVLDDLVDAEHAKGSKRWLPAQRDSIALKVCCAYAYGLRRRELTMLDTYDFGPNPHVPDYGSFGAVTVRWAKGTAGSGPRRRTVLTVPEFEWVVDLLKFWHSPEGRARFATADRSQAMWPTERRGQARVRTLDRAFHRARRAAGLPDELTMHALRHSYVTHLIEAGYDPMFVQQQVGHSYSSTTALYTSVSADFKQKVVQQMIAKRLRTGLEDSP